MSRVLKTSKVCEQYPEWTEGKYQSFVKSILRAGSRRWPPKYKVLNEAKLGKKTNERTGRLAEHYLCSGCGGAYPSAMVVVDHIEPVVATTGFVSWDFVIARLFCSEEGLQVMCKGCHQIKTKEENAERKANNNKNKAEND